MGNQQLATMRQLYASMVSPEGPTFDTVNNPVWKYSKRTGQMESTVRPPTRQEIYPLFIHVNSAGGFNAKYIDLSRLKQNAQKIMSDPKHKGIWPSMDAFMDDFKRSMRNLSTENAIPSAELLGNGNVKLGETKRDLIASAMNVTLPKRLDYINQPTIDPLSMITPKGKERRIGGSAFRDFRIERVTEITPTNERIKVVQENAYDKLVQRFQPDSFIPETLPNGEAWTNPDGYRILKKTGSKLYRVYDKDGTEIGVTSSQDAAIKKAQDSFLKSEKAENVRFQPITPEQDAAFLRAAQAGDIETGRKLVIEAAKNADYFSHGDFRDAHRAPSGPAGTDADVMNGDAEPTLIQVAKGVHNQPSDYFDPRVGPRYYMYQDKAGMESLRALRTAMDKIQQGKKASVTVFRAVPIEIKGTKLENKDWVTPSKTYAISHGEARFGEGQYRIIKESVKAENLFWDGNDIREWGKDDSKDYFYRNVKNNIKSADPITYDDAGNIIPLSQRFNVESPDIRFQPDAASPSILNGTNGTRIIKSTSGKFRVYSGTGALLGIRDTQQAAEKLASKP
jgi:hypothetical protein